jgi:hypothetical protein
MGAFEGIISKRGVNTTQKIAAIWCYYFRIVVLDFVDPF